MENTNTMLPVGEQATSSRMVRRYASNSLPCISPSEAPPAPHTEPVLGPSFANKPPHCHLQPGTENHSSRKSPAVHGYHKQPGAYPWPTPSSSLSHQMYCHPSPTHPVRIGPFLFNRRATPSGQFPHCSRASTLQHATGAAV